MLLTVSAKKHHRRSSTGFWIRISHAMNFFLVELRLLLFCGKKTFFSRTSVISVLHNNWYERSHKIHRKTPRKAFREVCKILCRFWWIANSCKLTYIYIHWITVNFLHFNAVQWPKGSECISNPSKLCKCIGCKKFVVHTLLWSQEFVMQQDLEHATISASNLDRSWSISNDYIPLNIY